MKILLLLLLALLIVVIPTNAVLANGLNPPVVETLTPSNYTGTSVNLRGEIVETAYICDYRGFTWGTAPDTYTEGWDEVGEFGVGEFSHTVSITPGTRYYYRARAHSIDGWGYGEEVSFPENTGDTLSSDIYGIPGETDNPDLFHESGEGAYPGSGLPLAPFIYDQCNTMGMSINIFWILLALALSILVGIITFAMTGGNVMACAIAPGIIWGLFVGLGGGLVPLWTVMVYIVIAAAFVTFTRLASL